MADYGYITADAWAKGIGYSILASLVGGASKLAIRKSWLMVDEEDEPSESSDTMTSSENGSMYQEAEDRFYDDASVNESNENVRRSNYNRIVEDDENGHSIAQTVERDEKPMIVSKNATALCLRYSGMFGMTFVNPAFCVLAMNYASPSILAPFSGLTLVWIILCSEYFISERPQARQVIAACLIITGQVIVGIFGDHTNDDGITLEEVVESYQQVTFQLFFIGMAIWLSFLAYLIIYPPSPTMRRFAWGVASGSITGFQNFLKDSLSIIKACKANGDVLPWYFFILMCLAALTAFCGLLVLTRCMKRYDATFSSAMFVGSFIISASIMSDIHYHTFSNLAGVLNYIMYPFGLFVLMVGLYLLVVDTKEPNSELYQNQIETSDDSAPRLDLPLMSTSEDEDGADHVLS